MRSEDLHQTLWFIKSFGCMDFQLMDKQ